jgi:glycosyltransferase involved in cell wall biosynthesis
VTLAAIVRWSFGVSVWLIAVGWLWQLWQWIRHLPEVAVLSADAALRHRQTAGNKPDLTVIVPACNEQAAIETTLRSLMASVSISVEIFAVDDRSTDATGTIMDRVAAQDLIDNPAISIQVIHINHLPESWLGKPNALATAARRAQADWLLFTDGDVVFAPEALSAALHFAESEQADHLVVMPDWIIGSSGEAAMHGAMHALTTWTFRLWKVADPKARDFLGVGAFNLVRRDVYEDLGGFEALRMEVLEDLRFGWMVKRAGYRQRVALGPGLVSVRWSEGAWGVVRNLEKNVFALYRYNTALTLLAAFGLAVQIVWPLAALSSLSLGGWVMAGGLAIYAGIAGIYIASRRVTRVSPWYVVFFPFAAALFLFAMLRSMTLALMRGGVVWRGTLYSLKELRAHAGRRW